jgi:glutathione-specific gamma-glutamylcyclotransferase
MTVPEGPSANSSRASLRQPGDRSPESQGSIRRPSRAERPPSAAEVQGDLWIFGYGSLMWRPGFDFVEQQAALLRGWRRRLCIYSHVHRGTPKRPGLVLGLDRGGACHGAAFRIDASAREPTLRYLREREQVTSVYLERNLQVLLVEGRIVTALTYVADRKHPQYAGALEREQLLRLTAHAAGRSGRNADYILNTVAHLEKVGVRDATLEWLAERLRERRA